MRWADPNRYPSILSMQGQFSSQGLPHLPVPEALAESFADFGSWLWGTREEMPHLYDLDLFIEEAAAGVPDYCLVGHDGHGINSFAIHYYLSLGRLTCLIQEPWGGALTDDRTAAKNLARHVSILEDLGKKLAQRSENHRLIVVQSGFYPSQWAWLEKGNTPEWENTPEALSGALQGI